MNNELNSLFQESGTSTTNPPIITSATTINSVEGDTINYEMVSDYGVGYEWENLPSGLVTVEGNTRNQDQ